MTFLSDRARRTDIVVAGFLVAAFLFVAGSHLWLVAANGSDVPFWDQWNGEGQLVYKPFLERGAGAVQWFAAHNEHRIFTTRLSDVILLLGNGQWDPLVQMCWNASFAALIAVMLCVFCLRSVGDRRLAALACTLVVLGASLPYTWENTLSGFQSQFYFLLILSLALFVIGSKATPPTFMRLAAVAVIGFLALTTLAGGTLACLATLCAVGMRAVVHRSWSSRRELLLMIVLLGLTLLGFAMTPKIEAHEALRAHTLVAAWKVFDQAMGWPGRIGIVIWIPAGIWLYRVGISRRLSRADTVLLALAAFVVLNAAAIAYARGSAEAGIASRYTDIVWLGWLVNLLALLSLAQRTQFGSTGRWLVVASAGYFVAATFSLITAGAVALDPASERHAVCAVESANVRNYVVLHDATALVDKPLMDLPFPHADLLRGYLDDPTIRAILPPGIRAGIIGRSGATDAQIVDAGLVLTGVPYGSPPAPAPVNGYFWGTWGKDGNAHRTHFSSPPIVAHGSQVRLRVSGFLGRPGMALYLEDIQGGHRTDLMPKTIAGEHWVDVKARIPAATYRLVAIDDATAADGWFAFTDPVEVGRFRPFAEWLLRHARQITLIGGLCFVMAAIIMPLRSRPA